MLSLALALCLGSLGGVQSQVGARRFESMESQHALRLFRTAKGADAEFVAELFGLVREVRVLVALAEATARERGYFELLADGRGTLGDLFTEWDRVASAPFDRALSEREARAFLGMLLDVRLRVRRHALRRFEGDARDLTGALALLVASAQGLAEVHEGIGYEPLAWRADLAAADLRLIVKDLGALHEVPRWSAPPTPPEDAAELERLVAQLAAGDAAGADALAAIGTRVGRTERGMIEGLFSTRNGRAVDEAVAAREDQGRRALERLAEMRVLLPFTGEGADAPEAVAKMSDTLRYEQAIMVGQGALALDPLNPELNLLLARAKDRREGRRFSAPYYDRFLVLRGIRFYDESTIRGRALDADEELALFEIQSGR